jgi:hypothetical protein
MGCPAPHPPPAPTAAPTTQTTTPATTTPVDEKPAPKVDAAPQGDIKTMFVDAVIVDCEGEGPMKCMRVRASESADWMLFYSSIEGFTHQEGELYELKVEVSPASNPPSDASSLRYRLIEIVSHKKVRP